MCGIAGIVSARPVASGALCSMTRALAHRGPDGEGAVALGTVDADSALVEKSRIAWSQGVNVGLGHRRLAILDLSEAGHQPMSYGRRYWITFNGEIYNYIELRDQLRGAGYTFETLTDTEVVMAAFDRWGAACLDRFNGMWAFCLVDTVTGNVLLARDRLGVKPLYFWRGEGIFLFASEIKALLLHPDVTAQANEAYCRAYLQSGTDESRSGTAFAGIERLPPASYVLCPVSHLLDASPPLRRYWEIRPDRSQEAYEPARANEIAQGLRELLEDAVRLRLRSDVPVGSALSGGLDSSGIVSIVNTILRRKVTGRPRQLTFSSVYPGEATAGIDESAYIALLAKALDVESHTVTPTVDQVIDEYDSMIYAMDTPPDGTCMSGWFTFRLVGGSPVSVTLEGQGADEQLAGYLAYHSYWLAQARHGVLPHWFVAMRDPRSRRFATAGLMLGLARHLGLARPVTSMLSRWRAGLDPYLPLNDRLKRDTTTLLPTLLHYGDRASMAHGIESRMPFIDYRVVEYCAQIPATYKLHGGWTKFVQRLALQHDLPRQVTWRRDKLGWPTPDRHWLRTGLGGWAQQRIEGSRFVHAIDDSPLRDGEATGGESPSRVIRRLNLAVWHDTFVRGQPDLRRSGGKVLPGAVRVRPLSCAADNAS